MQRAEELLRAKGAKVKDVAESMGYVNIANFSRDFRKRFGESPSTVIARANRSLSFIH